MREFQKFLKQYGFILGPASLAAMAAIRDALTHLKTSGFSPAPDANVFEFKDSWSLLGFEDIWDFERRWSRDTGRD